MNKIPIYWKTRLDEVEQTCAIVKKGRVSTPFFSAGGRPIYKIEYGQSNLSLGKANISSAMGAHNIRYYADKTGSDYIPTVFLCGCIHGGEFEGTAAMLNLIKLLETGTDYAGNRNDALVSACEKVHLILVPMVNPDGRRRIPFDSFVGKTMHDLRYYNQGAWKDGSLCGWPDCKAVHPIKDYVSYLGGYFNDDGINMMHEDFIGGKLSTGTQLVLDICKQEAPDFSILLHGGSNGFMHVLAPYYVSGKVKRKIEAFGRELYDLHKAEGIGYHHNPVHNKELADALPSFNLISAMCHCCGEPVITFESNQGLCDGENPPFTYEQIYRSHMILFQFTSEFVLKYFNEK